MDETTLYERLLELGLPKREADIYLFLSRAGPQKAQSVAAHLRIDRAQTYRSLMNLQEKGIVQQALEAPTRYLAVPIEALLEARIGDKKGEVARMESGKGELVDFFRRITARDQGAATARFQVLAGRRGIYARIAQMVEQSRKELLVLTTSVGLIQKDLAGVVDALVEAARRRKDLDVRILADVSAENLGIAKRVVEGARPGASSLELRHVDLGETPYPRFVVKDGEELILCVISPDRRSESSEADTGLWVNSGILVPTIRASFLDLWRDAVPAAERIRELETGTPRERTLVLKEPEDVAREVRRVVGATKEDLVVISSSASLRGLADRDPFRECVKRGASVRIMAPVDLDNLEAARRLSKAYEVRHVPISYMSMMIADRRHLFIFKAPSGDGDPSPLRSRNVFYTSDRKYVERAGELMEDVWKRGTRVEEVASGGPVGTPIVEVRGTASVLDVVDAMLKRGVSSVLVRSGGEVVGIVDQRDILSHLREGRGSLKAATAAQIMSTPILTVDSETPLTEALRSLRERGIPRLAVMQKGRLVAMLT